MAITTLYLEENKEEIEHLLEKDYFDNSDLSCAVYNDVYVLPCRRVQDDSPYTYVQGGVCASDFSFIAGLRRHRKYTHVNFSITESYPLPPDKEVEEVESCIFGGVLICHFGHFFVESLTRLWFLNDDTIPSDIPIVFILVNGIQDFIYQVFDLMHIRDRVRILTAPIKVKKIIIPEQSNQIGSFVNPTYYPSIFTKIKDGLPKGDTQNTKVYLTRSKLKRKDCIGEEFFENFFAGYGFEILSPEKFSIEDQIRIVANADEIVCTHGTLAHFAILFCKDSAKLTFLVRDTEMVGFAPQLLLNSLKDCQVSFVDVSCNLLPTTHSNGTFLILPNENFVRYLEENSFENFEDKISFSKEAYFYEYLVTYAENYNKNNYQFKRLQHLDFFDVVNCLSSVLLKKKLKRLDFSTPSKFDLVKKLAVFERIDSHLASVKNLRVLEEKDPCDVIYRVLHVRLSKNRLVLNDRTSISLKEVLQILKSYSQFIDSSWQTIIPLLYVGWALNYNDYDLIIVDSDAHMMQFSKKTCINFIESSFQALLYRARLPKKLEDQFISCHGEPAWNVFLSSLEKYPQLYDFTYVLKELNFLYAHNIIMIKPKSFSEFFKFYLDIIMDIYDNLIEKDKKFIKNISERLMTLYFYSLNFAKNTVLEYDYSYKKPEDVPPMIPCDLHSCRTVDIL